MNGSKKQDKSFMKKIIYCICVVKSQTSIPKRIKSRNFDICTLMFRAVLFITAKRWKQLKHLSANEWINRCNINTYWNTIQPLEGMKF